MSAAVRSRQPSTCARGARGRQLGVHRLAGEEGEREPRRRRPRRRRPGGGRSAWARQRGRGVAVAGRAPRRDPALEHQLLLQRPRPPPGSAPCGALYAGGGEGASFIPTITARTSGPATTRRPITPAAIPLRQLVWGSRRPTAEGGSLSCRAQTSVRTATVRPVGDDHPGRSAQPGSAEARQLQHRRIGPEREAHHRLRPPQPVPVHLPNRARTNWIGDAPATSSGRSSTASSRRPRRRLISAGHATKALRRSRALTRSTWIICEQALRGTTLPWGAVLRV